MDSKLKIKIDINDSTLIGISDISIDYKLGITVISKDPRFEPTRIGETSMFTPFDKSISIICTKDGSVSSSGHITHDKLYLPISSSYGVKHTIIFKTDDDRRTFLKKLYTTLNEWGNYWYGFSYDSITNMVVDGNIWSVKCNSINTEDQQFTEQYY